MLCKIGWRKSQQRSALMAAGVITRPIASAVFKRNIIVGGVLCRTTTANQTSNRRLTAEQNKEVRMRN